MESEPLSLHCTVVHQELGSHGDIQKSVQYKNCTLVLGRNEFQDVILKVHSGKRDLKYVVRDLVLYRKFVKEGKATIKLPNVNTQFLLCNCPPDKLLVFLKTIYAKFECKKLKPGITERKKLLSDMPHMFQEISPLNMKDLQTLHNKRTKEAEAKFGNQITPKVKRKQPCTTPGKEAIDKENMPPKSSKLARQQLLDRLANGSLSKSAPVPLQMQLSKEQLSVLNTVRSGRSLFFTGSAGTGKSFLLKRIIGALPPQHTFATASTGVAACHIGGTTLHAFAGIGSGKADIAACLELASRQQVAQNWRKCHHLIIDEISMVDADFFDKLEAVARHVRRTDKPFGGIQLIVCGDFLQLPPVVKGAGKRKFAFQSRAWHDVINLNMELKEVRRQSDRRFIDILQQIRNGRCSDSVYETLRATSKHCVHRDGILATRLCTHKEDVEQINKFHLEKLEGTSKTYEAVDSDEVYAKQMNSQCTVSDKLKLVHGAQVMLAKNLDVHRGLVNGARGVVTGFEKGEHGYPIVRFMCGVAETIKPSRWSFKMVGGLLVSRRQVPLQLAWAISIHKSQGMTLDCVEISLGKVFESGQAYVALSRAKCLEGLRVLDFDKNCVRANPDVLKFYHRLQLHQRMMQTNLDDYAISEGEINQLKQKHW